MIEPHQQEASTKALHILKQYRIVLLIMQQRTGKTRTSLITAYQLTNKPILFITKLKAIDDILKEVKAIDVPAIVINYESLHKLPSTLEWGAIICDECQVLGTYPKPNIS